MSKLTDLIIGSRRTINHTPPYFDGCGFADKLVEAIMLEITRPLRGKGSMDLTEKEIASICQKKFAVEDAYSRIKED